VKLADFDFALPEELIAQVPLEPRDGSRLLVLDRARPDLQHRTFRDLGEFLRAGDLLVANDVRVIPARLLGTKVATGGKVELLLCEPLEPDQRRWRALGQSSKALRPGMRLRFDGGLEAEIVATSGEGAYEVELLADDVPLAIAGAGQLPLPPYIRRVPGAADLARYQTVYAARGNAVAAPTAGLHFTERVIDALKASGIGFATLTLDVGPGTFLPVRSENILEHRMHAERFSIPEPTAKAVRDARQRKSRVIPVGTTSLRALEAAAREDRTVSPGDASAQLFIYPGYTFRVADALLTNFHLPRSTLLMLVSALAGRERVLAAYAEAVVQRYRFFSYGDAMLVS
jgi:S-adenosylmethionine:tRNA ribosyltransferase-isomerase